MKEERMSTREHTREERLEQLRQMGFVDVDKWRWFDKEQQQLLLAVLRNDPQVTKLE